MSNSQSDHNQLSPHELLDLEASTHGYTIVQVVLNRALYEIFDYKLKGIYKKDIIGSRIKVSFGRGSNKQDIGIIYNLGASSALKLSQLKEGELIDKKSLIQADVFTTLKQASLYYHYPLGQCLILGLPNSLREGAKAEYKEIKAVAHNFSHAQDFIHAYQSLRSKGQKVLLLELQAGITRIKALKDQGFSTQQINALIKKKYIKSYDLASLSPSQIHTINQQCTQFKIQVEEDGSFSTLSTKGNATTINTITSPYPILLNPALKLNHEQEEVLTTIKNTNTSHPIFLLNGITGSGKTEIYLQLIEHILKQGKQALVLVPEIALTPQTFKRFYQRFNVPIVTVHSNLSDREKLDAFLDISQNKAMILIGTRSAIFSSMPNLGLIIIDEEHDSSFKQGDNLRYHARDLAIFRASLLKECIVLLGSATPSLESIYKAECGEYIRLNLTQRAKSAKLPQFYIVNLTKDDLDEKVKAGISTELEEAIGQVSAKNHQVLLFLNRRGYAPYLVCHHCGYIMHCPNCSHQMTVHKQNKNLICHICNTIKSYPQICPQCQTQHQFIETGLGTEQVEHYLKERFMDVGIERIDRDNINNKLELDKALERITTHQSQVIIGTQMIAKGHDFPDVTLVGILDIDSGLFSDDYRGLEYTAQLITQVAGRAGRADNVGQVYMQTRYPEHKLIQSITEPNFSYYNLALELLSIRQSLNLPPYSYQAQVMTNAYDKDTAIKSMQDIIEPLYQNVKLQSHLALSNISPINADRIEKKFKRYHFNITISSQDKIALHTILNNIVSNYQKLNKVKKDLRFAIDVDPINAI